MYKVYTVACDERHDGDGEYVTSYCSCSEEAEYECRSGDDEYCGASDDGYCGGRLERAGGDSTECEAVSKYTYGTPSEGEDGGAAQYVE